MKRLCPLVLALLLLLSACSGGGPATASQPAGTGKQESTAQPALTESATPDDTATAAAPTADTPVSPGSFSESDLAFVLDDVRYELKSDIAPLLEKLGSGYVLSEAVSCVYQGMDKTFQYPGINIYTFPTDGVDYIDEIELTDPIYQTPKGVAVGDSLEDIVAAYGSSYYDDNGVIVYTPSGDPTDLKNPRLYFAMLDGKIDSIGIYSASNIE